MRGQTHAEPPRRSRHVRAGPAALGPPADGFAKGGPHGRSAASAARDRPRLKRLLWQPRGRLPRRALTAASGHHSAASAALRLTAAALATRTAAPTPAWRRWASRASPGPRPPRLPASAREGDDATAKTTGREKGEHARGSAADGGVPQSRPTSARHDDKDAEDGEESDAKVDKEGCGGNRTDGDCDSWRQRRLQRPRA